MKKYLKVPFLLFALLTFTVSALAQETTGALQGVVTDPSGAVVAGANVEISSPALLGVKRSTTDNGGFYRFVNLPLGAYEISITATGFRSTKRGGIMISAGKEPTVDFKLVVGGAAETVEVTAESPIVEPTVSKAQTNIPEEVLDNIPKGRSYQSLINFAPGARSEPLQSTSGPGYQIDGASNSENAYLVEGMDTTHIQTGRSGMDVPFEFVQEVQIKSSGFEAEHGGALGGVVNVVQKRGSNTWHGSLVAHYRGDRLNATPNIVLRQNPQISTQTLANGYRIAAPHQYYTPVEDGRTILEPGFELGGALAKDRLWLFTSYIPRLDWQNRTVHFRCTTGSCTGATNNQIGPRNFAQFIQTHNSLARMDYRVSDAVRVFGAWQNAYEKARGTSQPGQDAQEGTEAFVNASRGTDPRSYRPDRGYASPNAVYTTGADVVFSNNVVLTGRYGYWFINYHDNGTPVGLRYTWNTSNINFQPNQTTYPGTPAVPAAFQASSGSFNIPATGAVQFDVFKRHTITTDLAVFKRGWSGTHNFKFGWTVNRLINDVNYQESPQGLIQMFWNSSRPGGLRGAYGYYVVRHFERKGEVSSNNHSLYAQDSWTMGRGFTLNAGIRFDKERLPSFTPGYPDISFGFGDKIAPRIGAAYDVMQNGKWKLYGSFGWFYDIMKYELPRGSFGGEYWHNCYYTLDSFDYTLIQPVPDANGRRCPGAGGTPGTKIGEADFRHPSNDPADNTIDPDLMPMRQAEYVLGSDFAITNNVGLEVRWARKRLHRTIEDVGVFVLDPATGVTNEIYYITNPGENLGKTPVKSQCPTCPDAPLAKRDYDGLEVRLTKRASNNWFATISYTWSRLYGNYSGLTSTDESGRGSPNVNRFFDIAPMAFTATGKLDEGRLATDRPHTFKAFAWYNLKWGGMETLIGGTQLWYSGTPITTMVPLFSTDTSWQPAVARGTFQELTQDRTTGLVTGGAIKEGLRTEVFEQTDLIVVHELKVNKNNERQRLSFEWNVENLFNQNNFLRQQFRPTIGTFEVLYPLNATGGDDWLATTKTGYNYIDGINGVGAQFAGNGNVLFNPMYGLPDLFQGPRTMRVKVAFKF